MNHLDPRLRGRTSSSRSDELPRFDLPGESAATGKYDASDAARTLERPALRHPSRPAIRRPSRPDETDEVAVEQILLETYIEPPAPRRPEPPPLFMPVFVPAPPAPASLAEVDALLDHSPASVAPVALPVQQPFYVQDAPIDGSSRVGVALAMTAVFVLTAVASFTLLAKPETLARVRGAITSRFTQERVTLALPPPHLAAPTLPKAAPPPPPATMPTLAVESLPKPVAGATTTLVMLPRYAEGHRVFVDGIAVATDGATLSTRCGRHAIKIGSTGKGRTLDLPCGGELVLK